MSIHQTTASNLVMVLVRAGLVAKHASAADRRWVTLAATTAGERLLAETPGPHQGVLPAAIWQLSDEQRQALASAPEPLLAQLDISATGAAATPAGRDSRREQGAASSQNSTCPGMKLQENPFSPPARPH